MFNKNKQNINPACACHIYLIYNIILIYLFFFKLCVKNMVVKDMRTRMTPIATSFHSWCLLSNPTF